ncbi:hypothetical protein AAT19DRAFT_11727 [Rhodotorula toruloides]|uniref:Uncharacterized protein n=1 Tax=Rhodotorula toruloides TaxID=5286 RepID=A0A2S9ZWE9_RHOTO|nr:hypothetical protein AAT19DRAFT_11727 [Rhodotorula toruloides]
MRCASALRPTLEADSRVQSRLRRPPSPSPPHTLSRPRLSSSPTMLSKTLLAISALSAVALAAPEPGVGVNVVKQANYNEAEKAAKISLKEICYRNLYADVGAFLPLARLASFALTLSASRSQVQGQVRQGGSRQGRRRQGSLPLRRHQEGHQQPRVLLRGVLLQAVQHRRAQR